MKYLKLILILILMPFIELFILNRYITNIIEINILFSLAVYISLKENENILFLAFITGIISDIFNNDIVGINAVLFLVVSFVIYYSKSFVIIASRFAESLMLAISFILYLMIKLLLIYFTDSNIMVDYSLYMIVKTLFLNILTGLFLFYVFDWISLCGDSQATS